MKIAFFDRDGVINKKAPEHEYIKSVAEFEFTEGIFELLSLVKNRGYEIIIITNQRGVARGHMTEEDLHGIHAHMLTRLSEVGVNVLDILYCPHEKNTCDCRKPKPGMLTQAIFKYNINLAESILVSDSDADVAMGKEFGIGKNILIETNKPMAAKIV